MPVQPNKFANQSAEAKKNQINALHPHNRGGKRGGDQTHVAQNNRLASEWLRQFYRSHPRRLKKLMMAAIEFAEAGHARFAEIILDRLEGPVKHEPQGPTFNFNFISDAERERAKSVVDDILAMDAKTIVIPALPQESTCPIPETSSTLETPDLKPAPTT